jgi:anaerobic selenocysteine-containing dehydrogenase/Fe-S-cluster-containing dehydrogenase component
MKRREFLKVVGVAGSAALTERCSPAPPETLIPYLIAPDDIIPGEAAFVATTCRECPAGCGLLAKVVDGRVIKAEGNPGHPISMGALCARGQASVQSLYNPDRFTGPLAHAGDGRFQSIEWDVAEEALAAKIRAARSRGPDRVAWIGQVQTGALEQLTREWLAMAGSARRLFTEGVNYNPLRHAAELLVGQREIPAYRFDRANFVLSFGADFLDTWLSNVEFTAHYAAMRRRRMDDPFGCFVFAAPRLSLTGLNADGWLAVRSGAEAPLALAVVHSIVANGLIHESMRPHLGWIRALVAQYAPEAVAPITGVPPDSIEALARQFATAAPSLAVGGNAAGQAADATQLELAALLLNAVAGNIGRTVEFGAGSALDMLAAQGDLRTLMDAMTRGEIDVLLVHHANPAYAIPGDGFNAALAHVPFVVSFATAPDETTRRVHLVLPDHHAFESWGDYSPRAGIDGVQQPAMTPLFSTRATGDVLLNVARRVDGKTAAALGAGDYASWVKQHWIRATGGPDVAPTVANEGAWNDALRQGGRFFQVAPSDVTVHDVSRSVSISTASAVTSNELTLIVFPSPFLFDGRLANNPWLQEIPDPVSTSVWNAWIEIHPDTAARLGIADREVVSLRSAHGRVSAPARLYEGVRPDVVAMPLGYGRTGGLRYADGRGARAAALYPPYTGALSDSLLPLRGISITREGGGRRLTILQGESGTMADRGALPWVVPASDRQHPRQTLPLPNLYPPHTHPGHRWGMAIDLNACTGCSACVVACYAENNVPVVGPEACAIGREMSWIRIERRDAPSISRAGLRRPGSVFLPMLCQQCDEAPCEAVCPVYATYHNPEGLNAQVYVRCIGTRFCSNNCPYKVRRFNFARPSWPSPLVLQLNPDVTARSAGVMEKCTFCVQRIQAAKNVTAREGRSLRDGDVVPACAQTCPAQAIVFGDLNDPASRVARLSLDARGAHYLEELNTRPAITYLKRIAPEAPAPPR